MLPCVWAVQSEFERLRMFEGTFSLDAARAVLPHM